MAGRKSDFTLPTLDDLFSTQELRDDAKLSKIRDIPLELIDDFPDHPFKVRDDEDMIQLVEKGKRRAQGRRCCHCEFVWAIAETVCTNCVCSGVH